MGLWSGKGEGSIPVGKIRGDFREELPFVMGLEGWVNVQTTGRSRDASMSRTPGKHGVYREPCELCHLSHALETEGSGRKGRLEPEGLDFQANTAYSLLLQQAEL